MITQQDEDYIDNYYIDNYYIDNYFNLTFYDDNWYDQQRVVRGCMDDNTIGRELC